MKIIKITTAAVLAAGISMPALSDVYTEVSVMSEYLWRGVSQSSHKPSTSVRIDYVHDSGIFLGTASTTIDWTGDTGVGSSSIDTNFYVGYSGPYQQVDIFAGLVTYQNYNNDSVGTYDDYGFSELIFDVTYDRYTAGFSLALDSDAEDVGVNPFVKNDIYYHADMDFELGKNWLFNLSYGYYFFTNDSNVNALNYGHTTLDLTRSFGVYGDTVFTLSQAEKASGDNNSRLAITWKKMF